MKCPFCGWGDDKVIDSRGTTDGGAVRRRRECLKCGQRFTTYEYIEEMAISVVKKDGRRQPFDRQKIIAGIRKACEKRVVSGEKIDELTGDIERQIHKRSEKEVSSGDIGRLVMDRLIALDEVAYVRFASVYRQFKDVNQFMIELKGLLGKKADK